MIKLTRLSGEPFVLNAELIRYVEQRPDTFITLTSGDRIVVREAMDEVIGLAVRYQQSKYLVPTAPAGTWETRATKEDVAEPAGRCASAERTNDGPDRA